MIIIKIFGGLGNQMFQYAFGKALSIKYKRDLVIDKSYFEKENYPFFLHPYYPYRLDLYHTKNRFASQTISKYTKVIKFKRLYYFANIFSSFPYFREYIPKYFTYNNFTFEKFQKTKIAYLYGYWQKYDLLEEFREQIVDDLRLFQNLIPKTSLLDQIRITNSISVHFRRGDYISNPQFAATYAQCTLDYYKAAMDLFKDEIENPVFYIFSNDIDWVKQNLKTDHKIVFVENIEHDYEELYLMSQCKHNVIANSSFSWMGAWLNENPKKSVIAPQKWFSNVNRKNDIYYPKKWRVIQND